MPRHGNGCPAENVYYPLVAERNHCLPNELAIVALQRAAKVNKPRTSYLSKNSVRSLVQIRGWSGFSIVVDTQRNLLVGVLALQCHLVTGPRLVAALEAWVKQKSRPLDSILLEQGALQPGAHATLLALVQQHLAQCGNQVEQSLAVFAVAPALKDELLRIADPDLHVAVSRLTLGASTNDHLVATLGVTLAQVDGDTPLSHAAPDLGTMLFDAHAPLSSGIQGAASHGARFRILRPHAKGGLGEVFLAQDQELNREVALKEIQAKHAGRKSSRSRFLLEAEITGSLEHPGIVPVYGMGSYPDGRPYYAMRFIKGDSLESVIERFHTTDWSQRSAGEQALELRRLLRCFIDVCNAIEYAHSRGVLHRDLKPANIMLGKYGETLVVDWGLAKMLDRPQPANGADETPLEPASANAVAGTRMGAAVGTPSFMSPEQAAGNSDQLGPASDVYSLGATLYAVLTGDAPFQRRDVECVLDCVKNGRFPPPREFNRQAPKPLEAICLRAMALKPSDRYPSARALADDVEHWLADEATVAYREPWRERCLRWARRHKTWTQAAAGTISVVAITAVVAGLLINQSRRNESTARRSAEVSFLQARRTVDDFFTRISENKLLNVPGLQPLRKELLVAASQYYRGFIAQRENDPTVQSELAETHYRLGLIASEIDGKKVALQSLTRALALQRSLRVQNPNSHELSSALANTCNAIGGIKQDMGELSESLRWFKEAKTIRESIARRYPHDASLQRKLANSHNNVATVLARQGHRQLADREFEQANMMRARLAKENPDSPIYRRDLAQGYFNLAQYKKEADDPAGALKAIERAVAAFQALVDQDPRVIDHRRELAWTHRVRGDLLAEIGQPADAVAAFEQARQIAERLAWQNPLLLELQSDVAAIYADLGRIKHRTAELPQAVGWYRRSRTIREQLVAADPAVEGYQRDLASCELHLGMANLDVGSLADALDGFQRALQGYAALAGQSPEDVTLQDGLAQTHRNIGLVYRAEGDPSRALAAFEEARRIYARLAQKEPAPVSIKMGLADALLNVAVDSRVPGRMDEASTAARLAADIQGAVATANPKMLEYQYVYAETLYMRGLLELGSGDHSAAFASYRAAVSIARKLTDEHGDNLKYRSMLGTALDKQAVALWLLNRNDEALESASQGNVALRSAYDAAPQVVQYRLNLSDNYFNLAKFERESGRTADSVANTLKRKALWPDNASECFRIACELAQSAQSLDASRRELSLQEREQRSRCVEESILTLQEAIAAGWSDVDAIRTDSQLSVLRDEPGFQKLLVQPASKPR